MGRKLDLSGLTDEEAEHVLMVVQRDMKLRKTEEERLSEMKQELAEEGSRCSILSKQHRFNEHCCIRCCAPFTFLLNPKRQCLDCRYNVCKTCRAYCQRDKAWLCSACQKGRILRTQSLEWYYNNVKSRFKKFGSAKVLKTLYRKHSDERGPLLDLPEGNILEGSNDNNDSVCGSDSAFYKQSEGHSMAETLTVALRVAEEAIEEAISKAEEFSDSLEKQNEARYLRDHKEELIEELATTIVQKRSRSAFSLTSDDSPDKGPEDQGAGASQGFPEYPSLKRDAKATSLPSWKSVDRLDNSSASSVLHSPDGNWIALHSSQLSRPSLLTKRKSLMFSALEKESGVVSAYDEMGSESGGDGDEGGWGAALRQFRRRLSDETYYTDSQHDPEWTFTRHPPATSPSSGQYTNTETLNSDSEASSVPCCARPRKPPHNLLRKRGPPLDSQLHHPQQQAEVLHQPQHHLRHQGPSPYQLPPEALDVNFNPKVMGDSSEAEERQNDPIRRSRRRRKSKRESSSSEPCRPGGHSQPQTTHPLIHENGGLLLNALLQRSLSQDRPLPDLAPAGVSTPVTADPPEVFDADAVTPEAEDLDTVALSPRRRGSLAAAAAQENLVFPGGSCPPVSSSGERLGEELRAEPGQPVRRANSEGHSSSEDELGGCRVDQETGREGDRREKRKERDGEWEGMNETLKERQSNKAKDNGSRMQEEMNGPERNRRERLRASHSMREDGSPRDKKAFKGGMSFEFVADDKEGKRAEKREGRIQSKTQHKRDVEKEAEGKGLRGSSTSSPAVTPSSLEGVLSDGQKYSAASLCSITTEVLKVLNATEDLIGEAGGEHYTPPESMSASPTSTSSETCRLDRRLTKMEENVYLAASAVYGLEGALGELEECARSISSGTTNTELAFLEDQVATAAAQVQQSELQISNIEARISALKTAGLNVTACNYFKFKPKPKPQTLDSSRHQRRKLPAPPLKEILDQEQQVKVVGP